MSIHFGNFELDEGTRQLLRRGEPVHIPAKQFLLLQILLEQRPNAVSKRELYDRLWPSTFVSDTNLPSLINDLRTLLDDDPRDARFIRTVHGFGYAFCGDAGPRAQSEADASAFLSGSGWQLRLQEGETIVGRDVALAGRIDDVSISRRHAAIVCSADRCSIRDLGSKNGTFVGSIRIRAERELHDGDVVSLGNVRLVFHRAAVPSTVTVARVP